jgi:hypothetical protein
LLPITNAGSTSAASYPSTTNVNTSFASSATSLLLNFTNAGIYDATSKNDLETVGNAQISTAISAKWGSGCMAFDGADDWLDFPQTDNFAFRTGDFTVEFWAYFNTASTAAVIHSTTSTANIFGVNFTFGSGGLFAFTTGGTSVSWPNINPSTGQWGHHAFVRSGSTLTWYINGVSQGGKTFTNDVTATGRLRIGADSSGTGDLNGYLQDVRFTKGYARYVTGTGANAGQMVFNGTNTLALPTAAFPTL